MHLFGLNVTVRIKAISVFLVGLSLSLATSVGHANPTSPEVIKIFPADLGSFHRTGLARQIMPGGKEVFHPDFAEQSTPVVVAESEFGTSDGEKLLVAVTKFENDSTAYANLTGWRKYQRDRGQIAPTQVNDIGTASALISDQSLAFFKGKAFVTVTTENGKNPDRVTELARLFAGTLDSGEGDIPVLIKHLPNWPTVQHDVVYVVAPGTLEYVVPNQPVLKELSFAGGTEAVVASYGPSQLVIVEFTTPQFSIDNDQRIWTRIDELKNKGEPTPTAYRRVGNYSVFVFNAPDEKTANALVDQVKYEQVVQWLGEDPHLYERLQRYFRETSAGVLVAVLKSSGLSLLFCLAAGAFIGALLFRHRRAQRAALYSDAGGSIRLNLDELTGPNNSQRLLESRERSETDSANS